MTTPPPGGAVLEQKRDAVRWLREPGRPLEVTWLPDGAPDLERLLGVSAPHPAQMLTQVSPEIGDPDSDTHGGAGLLL